MPVRSRSHQHCRSESVGVVQGDMLMQEHLNHHRATISGIDCGRLLYTLIPGSRVCTSVQQCLGRAVFVCKNSRHQESFCVWPNRIYVGTVFRQNMDYIPEIPFNGLFHVLGPEFGHVEGSGGDKSVESRD